MGNEPLILKSVERARGLAWHFKMPTLGINSPQPTSRTAYPPGD